jgi:hypothetical protein
MNTCGLRFFLVRTEPGSGGSDPQTPRRVAGWISCQRRIFETLVFSLQPPSNKFGANGKSPLKWTGNNSLVTINPPCRPPVGWGSVPPPLA